MEDVFNGASDGIASSTCPIAIRSLTRKMPNDIFDRRVGYCAGLLSDLLSVANRSVRMVWDFVEIVSNHRDPWDCHASPLNDIFELLVAHDLATTSIAFPVLDFLSPVDPNHRGLLILGAIYDASDDILDITRDH